ncbi:hypothetical protein NO559_05945 [Dasania sp. GY-MA-18]|uniref:SxtJ n=1 Tax=Dasania phycosphaerae TaxID=2950436 RepID=A0A9J6RL55_9GAMM|nr:MULTISPECIES: hypothetical protein [Dasania]MCR8922305.1 hypothetical protein [Dasania sp. GY-MA-18]MCZ0864733.1 hypothetical protein [Dasania phycosphaerae]MCZ0868461.1 hypothetical protein [Dasania phycosphaerae]
MDTRTKTLRIFIISLSLVAAFWFSLFNYWQQYSTAYVISAYLIIGLFACHGLWQPQRYLGFYCGWIKVSHTLNRWLIQFLLTMIFFIIITPSALLYRLSGKNIRNSTLNQQGSYRINSSKKTAQDMEHPF